MQVRIDTDNKTLVAVGEDGKTEEHDLYSSEAFGILSQLWLITGWATKYTYDFQWLGRQIIQMPQDMVRLQEVVWATRPTVVVETGIAHGGSTVFFSSLMEIMGSGRVIAVDIEIRPHNRAALEEHPLRHRYTLIERSSTDPQTLDEVRALLRPDDRVMVVLDSNHTKAHVAQELEMYAPLVTSGCYLVVADGVMTYLEGVPGSKPGWGQDNPLEAMREFRATHDEFELDPSYTRSGLTYFQEGYLRRK